MEINASNAGVAQGGLVSTDEIRILICYILHTIKQPVPGQQLSELLHYEGVANYFEVSSAFAELCENGLIAKNINDNNLFEITPKGSTVATTLKTSVPLTVRDKAYSLAVRMLSRIKYAKETTVDITPLDVGYNIRCAINEGSLELMAVSLFVPDEAQANSIKERFVNDPTIIYSGMIELLTDTSLN